MLPAFLVTETLVREQGVGPDVALGPAQGKPLRLTLGINRIIEQESLDLSIWGSADQQNWGTHPLASFPQKFYCGTYHLELDLSSHAEITHLQARWNVSRWGRGDPSPLFEFYLFAQETAEALASAEAR